MAFVLSGSPVSTIIRVVCPLDERCSRISIGNACRRASFRKEARAVRSSRLGDATQLALLALGPGVGSLRFHPFAIGLGSHNDASPPNPFCCAFCPRETEQFYGFS